MIFDLDKVQLKLAEVFFEFENFPILFSLEDNSDSNNIYFGFCSEIRYEEKYILVKINKEILSQLKNRLLDLNSVYKNSNEIYIYNKSGDKIWFIKSSFEKLGMEDKPKENLFLKV